jgi:hypothetical protein
MLNAGSSANIVGSLLRSNMLLVNDKFLHREAMFNRDFKHFRPLLTLLVVLGLVFSGVRVPDISRPHRPKQTHRVVLEKSHKTVSNHLKQCGDLVAVIPPSPIFSNPISYRAELQLVSPRHLSPLSFPNSGRSPPVSII